MEKQLTAKSLFSQDNVKAKFNELMGKKAQGFITSVLQVVSSNQELAKADPYTIYNAAAVAATLDLPLNNNLGFAYIVPYNKRQPDGSHKQVAQFQMGYKGFIQLAQRTGQYKTISAAPIYDGQLVDENPLTGFVFDFKAKKSDVVIGYAAYFSLLNGFEKTLFMKIQDVKNHGSRYSKTFNNKFGLWNTDFESMALKTPLKLLISKFGPMSIEMHKAITTDQAVINNVDATDITYVDNEPVQINKEAERITLMIADAQSIDVLEKLSEEVELEPAQLLLLNKKKEVLSERR